MTVRQDGTAYAFEHVDKDASRARANMVPALQKAIDYMGNRPMGGKVTIGTLPTPEAAFPWSGIVDVHPNVEIEGVGFPKIEVTGATSRMFRTDPNAEHVTISNLDIEANGNVATAVFDVQDGFYDFDVHNVEVRNGTEVSSAMDVLRIGSGRKWSMENVHSYRSRYLCWNGSGANDGNLERCITEEINDLGGLYRYGGGTRRTHVHRNTVLGHLPTAEGGHFIQGDGEANGDEEHELWITHNLLQGLQNAFFERDADGAIVRNGAAADMIAIRNTKLFDVSHNILRYGGEFGITAVHATRHGSIAYNQAEDLAGSMVTLGNTVAGTTAPRDVSVTDNRGRRIGLDPNISDAVRSMIHVRAAVDCEVWDNRGWQLQTHGLYIHSTTGAPTVERFTHGDNRWFSVAGSPVFDTGGGAVPIAPNWTQGDYSGPVGNVV